MEPATLELGVDTFGDVTTTPDGAPVPHAQVIRDLVDQAVLADQVGIDVLGIGEHHREDYAVSAPDVVLAAIASRTQRIRLGSAVTILSSDDPVRVFQRFSTLDALSSGRAEAMLGRGSFVESFALFGLDLGDYEQLFEEKLELFARLRTQQPVTWSGALRSALRDQSVFPTVENPPLTTWVAVGGSPESVVRTARHGLPIMFAIIGGSPQQFLPYADLYRRALDELDQAPQPAGVHSHGHVAPTDEQALEELWPHYREVMARLGRERGWPPMTRDQFETAAGPDGALFAGSPETVARKIAATVRSLGLQRFDLKYSHGTLPHDAMLRSIELYGTRVAPLVRDMLAGA
ncbi:LLM class flavin-dependent oxidoreductase [Cellulomonas sp. PhB143]|uniref:LLM class flavin-dependent oxidoreductase n=1 Tax=Cellulomonas sp. PhB143 TaxID=2485186 RepID=UPI000F4A8FED|nr:LLM class flavin-dependent oxidoreductase [Cellulomonas sp. PhB143]ROS73612.1 putative LLM family oxidoreductase [Cellulomonas sp. PhB143]